MLPKVAIIGKQNVGKSTLFNRLIGRRKAIVDKTPGVTRDRIEAIVEWGGKSFIIVDTGGIIDDKKNPIVVGILKQITSVLKNSELILFLLDARHGITQEDETVYKFLIPYRDKVVLVLNKIDDEKIKRDMETDYFKFGFNKIFEVSAEMGRGIGDLLDYVIESIHSKSIEREESIPVAIIGRPNVGKSTLLNVLCNEERAIVTEIPGTTRDSFDTIIEYENQKIKIIDTAGIRKKAKIHNLLENISVIRAKQGIRMAKVVLFIVDALDGFLSQDLNLLKYIENEGKGIIVLINKWDAKEKDEKTFDNLKKVIEQRMPLLSHAPVISISAKNRLRTDRILPMVIQIYNGLRKRINTSQINADLSEILLNYQPAITKTEIPKVYYATQQSVEPPTFILFVNNPCLFRENYKRFIHNKLRELYGIDGVPIRVVLRKKK
ncbi:MAG: ribosome biogenesis GTPase Der [Candidatus Hydrogenedentota bacterium]